MQNNGVQRQAGLTGQPARNVHGMIPAAPIHNNYHPAMPSYRNTIPTQQGASQGQPPFARPQMNACQRDGMIYNNMPVRDHAGAPMGVARGNTQQLAQQPPQAQLGFVGQQMENNRCDFAMVLAANPVAMDGLVQFYSAITQQTGGQFQALQSQQTLQLYQAPQNYQNGQAFNTAAHHTTHERTSGHNTPIAHSGLSTQYNIPRPGHLDPSGVGNSSGARSSLTTASPTIVGSPSDAGITSSGEPQLPETPEEFQDRVNGLIGDTATTFKDYLEDEDAARFEAAIWKAKRKGSTFEDKSEGYPDSKSERSEMKQRLFNAILNIDGKQDPVSESDAIADSLAVRMIKRLSGVEVELIVQKLMVSPDKVLGLGKANLVTQTG